MPLPQPEDVMDRIRALEQAVRELRSSVTNQGGFTEASQGWKIPNQTLPSTPDSGGHLTANGDEPMWSGADGSVYSLKPSPPFTPGAAVASPPVFTSPSSPPEVTVSVYQDLRNDAQLARGVLVTLLQSLRAANIINS
ncbi:hypothetical protein [Nonomuraea rubra]|uniref:Uncharacterized protein n=1 Tax=Nonomuraea rubra TaxID=46180 RepID=A0A7X0P6V0_9ACTN|nr:hypothetical protein [Nonomuraea rubra]MBB6556132.1 hypothetical protein [Nonomuraea rubra]